MKILILSPHTDDAQFCCGGSVSKWIRDGHDVYEFAFSFVESLGDEWRAAMAVLGIKEMGYMSLQHRRFPDHRQEILDCLINLRDEFDLVACPSSFDTHQDHQVIRAEAFRAFKTRSIIGYEVPWNCVSFTASKYVRLSSLDVKAKREACAAFKSQLHRPYADPAYITSWANSTGIRIGAEYAEAFEWIREVE